jgi:hypothetical protein
VVVVGQEAAVEQEAVALAVPELIIQVRPVARVVLELVQRLQEAQ